MQRLSKSRHPFRRIPSHAIQSQSHFEFEHLETRTLLSAWSTVALGNSFNGGSVDAMTSDASGNVYAAGFTTDANAQITGKLWKKPAGGNWAPLTNLPNYQVNAITVDATGNLFLTGAGGLSNRSLTTWEMPAGSTTFTTIDSDTNGDGSGQALAFDRSGNLFVTGYDSLKIQGNDHHHWLVRKGAFANGKWTFTTVDEPQYKFMNDSANGIVLTSSGIYVAGYYDFNWTVRASATGATGTWTTVDSFRLDSTSNAASQATSIGADATGQLYVAGSGQLAVKTGNNKSYTYKSYWMVRESPTGAANSWSTIDNAQNWSPSDPAAPFASVAPVAIAHDYDNIYIVGGQLIRTRPNTGGNWANSDIAPAGDYYQTITADPSGNLYAGGDGTNAAGTTDDYLIRSLPAAPRNLTASPNPVQPSSQIDLTWANAAGSNETGFAVYRSTDGVNFTLLASLDASTTTYHDTALSPATKYYYYVVTLLNADGSSAPSATVTSTTSS